MEKTNRRKFLKRAGLGLASGTLAAKASAFPLKFPPYKSDRSFELGMASYTFREFGLDDTLAMTTRLGLKRIAFKSFHLALDSTEDEIRAVATKVKAAGMNLYGCGVVYMKTSQEVEQAFKYARTAGMEVIIGVPDHELLDLVSQKVKEFDIKVAIHNHGPGDKVYPTPESAYDRIQELDPRIGLCIDVGHTQRAGVNPAADIMRFSDRILDIHIKDVTAATGEGQTVEIGRGVIDIPAVLAALLKIKYAGTVSFEFEKDGKDPLVGVAESIGYVRGVLDIL